MTWSDLILLLLVALVLLPCTAYMVMKFGTAGYYQARSNEQQRQQQTKDL